MTPADGVHLANLAGSDGVIFDVSMRNHLFFPVPFFSKCLACPSRHAARFIPILFFAGLVGLGT